MATTYLSRAASGSVTSDKIFTISFWVKRGDLGRTQFLFIHENNASHTQKIGLEFRNTDKLRMSWYDGSNEYNLDSTMLFRDTSAWYHIVFRLDTTQSTDTNRVRIYVNGAIIAVEAIGGGSPTPQYPAEDATMNLGQKIILWGSYSAPGNYFNGSLSHCYYADGQSYDASTFGSTDATTGEWIINASPTVTYGTNGFLILKDGNTITDQSTNSSNFTLAGGTLTNTEDCPSDVFCTFNPLDNYYPASTFSNGNTTVATVSGNAAYNPTTMAVRKGKFYFEVKLVADSVGNAQEDVMIGISNQSPTSAGTGGSIQIGDGFGIRGNGKMWAGSGETTGWANIDVGDVVTIAVDFDNGKFYKGIDGVWGNSGDPTSGATGTGAYSFTVGTDDWFMGVNRRNTSATSTFSANFGNGYFGTTAISSAGTNASNIGKFEFNVPTGYTALSLKGINS